MEGGVDVVVAIHQQQVIALLLDAEIESRSARDPIPFCRIEIFDSIATRGDAEMIGIGAADQRVPAATTRKDVDAGATFEGISSPMSAEQIISGVSFEQVAAPTAEKKVLIRSAKKSVPVASTRKDVFAGATFEGVASPMSAEHVIS